MLRATLNQKGSSPKLVIISMLAVVIVLELGPLFLLFIISKGFQAIHVRPYEHATRPDLIETEKYQQCAKNGIATSTG